MVAGSLSDKSMTSRDDFLLLRVAAAAADDKEDEDNNDEDEDKGFDEEAEDDEEEVEVSVCVRCFIARAISFERWRLEEDGSVGFLSCVCVRNVEEDNDEDVEKADETGRVLVFFVFESACASTLDKDFIPRFAACFCLSACKIIEEEAEDGAEDEEKEEGEGFVVRLTGCFG